MSSPCLNSEKEKVIQAIQAYLASLPDVQGSCFIPMLKDYLAMQVIPYIELHELNQGKPAKVFIGVTEIQVQSDKGETLFTWTESTRVPFDTAAALLTGQSRVHAYRTVDWILEDEKRVPVLFSLNALFYLLDMESDNSAAVKQVVTADKNGVIATLNIT